jgi:hypothetical protein
MTYTNYTTPDLKPGDSCVWDINELMLVVSVELIADRTYRVTYLYEGRVYVIEREHYYSWCVCR